jgi:glycosyltransferase involved in cell wall biosynthesis
MLVSIVIDNYNYDRFVCAAIDSALSQSYQPVEVIVVDDGSTDQSRDLINRFGDQISTILQDNGGQASALNAGFARSQGEIVIFLDADDILLPHAVQTAVDAFTAQPDIARLQYRMAVIDRLDRPTGEIKPPVHIPLPGGDLRWSELQFPFDLAWLPTSGNAFSAAVLRKIMPIPEQPYRILADYYLVHLTALFGPILSLDRVCAAYRVHGTNNYETAARIDLAHIRSTLIHADQTRHDLQQHAEMLNLSDRPAEILSVSYVANRVTSFKLARDQHPIADDTPIRLWQLAFVAVARRSDVSWLMRLMFRLWLTLMIITPKRLAESFAEVFFFPERRQRLNHWLGTLHTVRQSR